MCLSIPKGRSRAAKIFTRRKRKHSLNAGAAIRSLVEMTTMISPTQTGFHKAKGGPRLDRNVDYNMVIERGFEDHLVKIYQGLCGGKATLSKEKFETFLKQTQGETLSEPLEKGSYTFQDFFELWSSSYRPAPLKPTDPTRKDLSKPISHYFISSSHNTYLLGNQITSNSSVKGYIKALGDDCRCIEIDVWNGVPQASSRSPSRANSPHPSHRRHLSASSVTTTVEGGFETIKHIISGKLSHSRTPSATRNTLEVPSTRESQATLNPATPVGVNNNNSNSNTTEGRPVERSEGAVDEAAERDAGRTRTRERSGSNSSFGSDPDFSRTRMRARSLANPEFSGPVEPIVMHAHTYIQKDWAIGEAIGFRDVCKTIRKTAFVRNHLPIIISLEVHADMAQQDVMVDIMMEEWGDLLLDEAFVGCDPRLRLPKLEELMDKILIKVKKGSVIGSDVNGTAHSLGIPLQALRQEKPAGGCAGCSSSDDDSTSKKTKISRRLSSLAVYTHSKHFNGFSDRVAKSPSHIFSLSESNIKKWYKEDPDGMMAHNKSFLMRAYPDPVARVDSGNMDPITCWRKGVQMVAMNWQTLDTGMMLNHAMFAGEAGWVLKPPGIRATTGGIMGSNLCCPQAASEGVDMSRKSPQHHQHQQLVTRTISLLKIIVLAGQRIPLIKGKTVTSLDPLIKIDLHVEGKQDPIRHLVPSRKTSSPDWGPEGFPVSFLNVANVVEEFSFLK